MTSDNNLKVSIITPEETVYQTQEAKVVVAPASLGQVAILPSHSPLFTKLNSGEIKVRLQKNQENHFAVFGGFMDVNNNQVIILADFAQRSEAIDLKTAQKAKQEAETLMKNKQKYSKEELLKLETNLKKALFTIKIAEKLKLKKKN